MKNLHSIVLTLLAIMLFTGCDKLEDIFGRENSNNPQIEMHTSEVLFTTDGGNNTISFTTNEAWTAQVINSRADNWCEIYPTSGSAGDATISVITTPNDTPDDRTASIVIKAGTVSKTVTVSQKQKDALTVTSSKFEVEATGGEVKIEVKANIDFEFAIDESAKEWIKYEGTRAIKTSTLTFSVAENDDTEKREGKIAIKSGEFNEVVTIYQAGDEPTIVISQNEYVVSSDGETIAVEVTSNVDVELGMPADIDWISENTTRAMSTNTYYFDIQPNEDYDQRSTEIKFTNKENGLSEIVKVVQTQKDALVVAKDSYTVNSDGDQIEIEVGHNVDFDIEIANDWITKVQNTRAFVTESIVFNIAKNPTNDNREGTIIFKSKDGAISQTVKVYQAQEDALIISKKDIVVSDEGGTISFELQTNVDFKVSDPDVDWLRPVVTRGLTTHTLNYTVDANTSYNSREAHIVVTNTKTNVSETITITQAQKDAIVLAKDSYTVNSEGDQIEIEVGHNVDFDIEITNDWITKVETRAFVTETLVFNIAKNPTYDNREGTIIFKSKDGKLSQTVKVYQAQEDALIISKKDIVVSDEGGTISFELQTNVDFKVSDPDVDWLRPVTTRGLTTHTLNYTVDANTSYDSREAHIVVTDTKNNKSETITITQAQKDAIILSNKYINIEREGKTIEVKMNTNVDFEVHIPSDITWIKQIYTRTLAEKSFDLEIAPNYSDISRNAKIAITDNNNMLSDTLVIIQQGHKTSSKIAYSIDEKELEGWSAGLFAGEGSYIMGKPHGDNGYIMTLGNILDEKGSIVYIDEFKRIREIFIDNSTFVFEYNNNGGVDISIIESGKEVVTEHINLDGDQSMTRSRSDHSQQVGIINLALNLQGIYDATKEMAGTKGFSKKGTIMFLANTTDAIRNLFKALGGPDIFNENFSNWLGSGMNIVGLAELVGMYGTSGLLGPAGAFISAYAGLYSTYLELYDEHIETYFGSCQAEIDNIDFDKNKLNINVNVSGYEPWYDNIECGVVVQEESLLDPRYNSGASIKPVTKNGNYTFVEGNVQTNKTYECRPFLIDKNRTSLWKGFIGDLVGPLVRYGKSKSIKTELNCSATTGDASSITENSAIVKCSYYDVEGVSGVECGVCVVNSDTGEIIEISTNSSDGEREINISSLTPATTYAYNAYIKINNTILAEGEIKTFTTDLPDVTGTWTCKEKHYRNNGEEYYTTYTVTLHKDGTVTTSKYDSFASATWSRSKTGLSVRIHVVTSYFTGSYWAGSDTGYDLSITFDDPANPTSGKGFAHKWAVSAATGIGSDYYYDLEMTR